MNSALMALYELQQVDTALARIDKQYRALDSGTTEQEAQTISKTSFEGADKDFHASSGELHDSELELQGVDIKIKEFETKLYDGKTTNFKELQSFGQEVEALKRQKSKLEDKILNLQETVSVSKTAKTSAQAELKASTSALSGKTKVHAEGTKKYSGQIRILMGERQKRAGIVPPILLKRYESLRKSKQGIGVTKLVDSRCETCHTNLPSVLVTLVTETDAIETCENCGRILIVLV